MGGSTFGQITVTQVIVNGDVKAIAAATYLVHNSQSFTFMPLPNGRYEFEVKPEAEMRLKRYLRGL